ncbi:DNA repair protein RecN [Brochothrix campestris]|uniref:DNA repair protein RecN n=1 Tax=Brochothrix campestris FSL F6-1037 TaxID=1265861 RepID=W7CYW9_9LIST|nr:DNA repair protein RecN [Brochothrix campestris]EUJ38238.1 DNA repair protein RecN [Brochothrix campestris FSL F6-1037]
MLQELSIRHLAIIEEVALSFKGGLTVLTGETGAGKSIIIDALGLIVGGRASTDLIRHGAEKAVLEALFTIENNKRAYAVLGQLGIEVGEDMVVLNRTLMRSGKNVCRINGKLVTTTNLRDVGETLLDIHSQHESQDLMNEAHHLFLIDQFAHEEIAQPLADYQQLYQQLKVKKQEFKRFNKNEQEIAQRIDMLVFQKKELASANLVDGEEETLEAERSLLANYEKINHNVEASYDLFQGEQSALDQIAKVMNHLNAIQDVDGRYKTWLETVQSAYYSLTDVATELNQELASLEFNPEQLNQIETRMDALTQLKRKYGDSVSAMMQYHDKISRELDNLQHSETHAEQLQTEIETIATQLTQKAEGLTHIRRTAAEVLTAAIHDEFKELYMDKAIFSVQFAEQDLNERGSDRIQFYTSTNPGEPLKPLHKIASGGELSRMMLAMKTIFSKHQGITSIIFDEVDTGVSGRVAQAIGQKIYSVSVDSQVLCISHLPQVASMADHHYHIEKQITGERTLTSVTELSFDKRVAEIAMMMSGAEMTTSTELHARELIQQAESMK